MPESLILTFNNPLYTRNSQLQEQKIQRVIFYSKTVFLCILTTQYLLQISQLTLAQIHIVILLSKIGFIY